MSHLSADRAAVPRMNRQTCAQCGLVNFAVSEICRRCGARLIPGVAIDQEAAAEPVKKHTLGRRLRWLLGMTVALLFVGSGSLLLTSDELGSNQRQSVAQAIALLQQHGFSKEAFVLRNLAHYRGTDNWWNSYVGHHEAYAATNFPFEVVTLYAPFFIATVDDTERAVILLHESHHLFGFGEETALEGVWREKQRLGWTRDRYSATKVWKNTREWTTLNVPSLFQCGVDGHSDCLQ